MFSMRISDWYLVGGATPAGSMWMTIHPIKDSLKAQIELTHTVGALTKVWETARPSLFLETTGTTDIIILTSTRKMNCFATSACPPWPSQSTATQSLRGKITSLSSHLIASIIIHQSKCANLFSHSIIFLSFSEIKKKFNMDDKIKEFGRFGGSDKDNNDNIIQWAGSYHQRQDFNKRRDHLASWTESLFSHWARNEIK